MFPVEVPEVYEPMVEQQHTNHHLAPPSAPAPAPGWAPSKRNTKVSQAAPPQAHHHHHHHHHTTSSSSHLTVPGSSGGHRQDKKEATQLSPVKKRVKESTPPSGQLGARTIKFYLSRNIGCYLRFNLFIHEKVR
jgi:hypothetical protein